MPFQHGEHWRKYDGRGRSSGGLVQVNQSKPIETEFTKKTYLRVETKLVRPHSYLCSETKRNTAQNESLGESPLATVSLRYLDAFVKRRPKLKWLFSGSCEGRTSPVHQPAVHELPQPVKY